MPRSHLLLVTVLGLLAGCASPLPAPVPLSEGAETPPEPGEMRTLGTFTRGMVFFSFVATGPESVVWAAYEDKAFGTMVDHGETNRGHGATWSPRGNDVDVRVADQQVVRTPGAEVRGGGGGGHGLEIMPEAYDTTWLVVFSAMAADGPGTIVVTYGSDVTIVAAPTEIDPQLFLEDDWTGAVDARAGRNDPGAGVVVAREISFTTGRGTLMCLNLGGFGARVDDVTITNSSTTLRLQGAAVDDAGVATRTPGSDAASAELFCLVAPPEDWTIRVQASVRRSGWNDFVLLADVALPEVLYRAF